SNRPKLKILSEFEVELGFSGDFLFAAAVDLSTGPSGSAYKGSDGRSLTSPKQSTQDGSDCGAASNVFRRALVGSQSTRRGFSLSTGDRIATAIDGDGAKSRVVSLPFLTATRRAGLPCGIRTALELSWTSWLTVAE